MKWPFMLKSTHDSILSIMQANLDVRSENIQVLYDIIGEKDKQIASLVELQVALKCNDYTSPERSTPKSGIETMPSGRGGWRARAEYISEKTIPVPTDSAAALELRVKQQGGTV